MKSSGIDYLLWCAGLLGFCGLHRFCASKIVSGIIWLLTGVLLFIGQIINLFLIPGMIEEANAATPRLPS